MQSSLKGNRFSVAKRVNFDRIGISHLVCSGIEFDLSESQIIWAPNGTAKSSKKTIEIATSIRSIDDCGERLAQIEKEASIKGALRVFGITNRENSKRVLDLNESVAGLCKRFEHYRVDENLKGLFSCVREEEAVFFIANRKELVALVNINQEIASLKESFLQQAFDLVELACNPDVRTCPLCGSELRESLLTRLSRNSKDRHSLQETLSVKYKETVRIDSVGGICERLEALTAAMKELGSSKETLLLYCMAGGKSERACALEKLSKKQREIQSRLKKLENLREASFKRLKSQEAHLRLTFESRFSAHLEVDDQSKTLKVTFDRAIDTYSTGEINLMLMLVKVQEFQSGDVEVMLIDDPLSSLDAANQYRVMFDLVSTATDKSVGSVIVFTHSLDALAIAQSQRRGCLPFRMMEKIRNRLFIQEIPNDMDLSLPKIIDCDNSEDDEEIALAKHYLRAACEREADDAISNGSDAYHAVFHYELPGYTINHDGKTLRNDYLVDVFEKYDISCFENRCFKDTCIQKALLLVATRVWLEAQLRRHATRAVTKQQLGEIVDELFPNSGKRFCSCPLTVDRMFLMSRKVLFNQAVHKDALAVPFEFAMSISINDLDREIRELRDAFNGSSGNAGLSTDDGSNGCFELRGGFSKRI